MERDITVKTTFKVFEPRQKYYTSILKTGPIKSIFGETNFFPPGIKCFNDSPMTDFVFQCHDAAFNSNMYITEYE